MTISMFRRNYSNVINVLENLFHKDFKNTFKYVKELINQRLRRKRITKRQLILMVRKAIRNS